MFFTYLRRELRRRMRQAVFIALGLAVGVGLVITVTAASAGVKNAQGTVLHALYGVGTDVTVTKTPKAGSFSPGSFGFGFRAGTRTRPVSRHQDQRQHARGESHPRLDQLVLGRHRGRPA